MDILAIHNEPTFMTNLTEAIQLATHQRHTGTSDADIRKMRSALAIIESNNLGDALDILARQNKICLVLISMKLAQHESSTWMTAVRSHRPDLPVMFVSDMANDEQISQAIAAETVCCPFNTPSGQNILRAILGGLSRKLDTRPPSTPKEMYSPPASFTSNLSRESKAAELDQSALNSMTRLTPRQKDVLKLIRDGHSNKQIARLLDLAEGTVKIHCLAIYRELGVSNRTQAAMQTSLDL